MSWSHTLPALRAHLLLHQIVRVLVDNSRFHQSFRSVRILVHVSRQIIHRFAKHTYDCTYRPSLNVLHTFIRRFHSLPRRKVLDRPSQIHFRWLGGFHFRRRLRQRFPRHASSDDVEHPSSSPSIGRYIDSKRNEPPDFENCPKAFSLIHKLFAPFWLFLGSNRRMQLCLRSH